MKHYIYQNNLIGKKQLRQILGWSFTTYDSMQACTLADELKFLGFKYATKAGISISIEDLRVPFTKNLLLEKANLDILNSEKLYLKGKITDVERFQKIIDTWSLTSESLKAQVIHYFKKYDPLNSVYIMAFSGARGNLAQVRQLVGMRGLMSDPSGEIMNLAIQNNFREGLTITDYLMSGYGARKGIIDTALKTANSGYLTRRLIDVAQDILIREKDCSTNHSFIIRNNKDIFEQSLGRVLNKSILDPVTLIPIAKRNTQVTSKLITNFKQKEILQIYIRSPLTCQLYRAICQQCYGWDLATENLIDIGEAIGILAGQSIGEPGTQLTMRTFHTGGIFTSKASEELLSPGTGILRFSKFLKTLVLRTNRGEDVVVTKNASSLILIPQSLTDNIIKIPLLRNTILFIKNNQYIQKNNLVGEVINPNKELKKEIKPILTRTAGEVIIPRLNDNDNNNNLLSEDHLLWLLEGDLYNSPINSYINFYSDYKLNKNSFIFRTKIINSYPGVLFLQNKTRTLYSGRLFIKNIKYSIENSKIFHLTKNKGHINGVLKFKNALYLIYSTIIKKKTFLKITRKNKFARLITNTYKTRTGGILYYDYLTINRYRNDNLKIYFKIQLQAKVAGRNFKIKVKEKTVDKFHEEYLRWRKKIKKFNKTVLESLYTKLPHLNIQINNFVIEAAIRQNTYHQKVLLRWFYVVTNFERQLINKFGLKYQKKDLKSIRETGTEHLEIKERFLPSNHRTLIWLEEETYCVKGKINGLLVKEGDFISKNFEIIPDKFSKTSGLVLIEQEQNNVQTIKIKSGLVYEGIQFTHQVKKIYFPGETIFSNIFLSTPVLCECINGKNGNQLLVRPIELYEFPPLKMHNSIFNYTTQVEKCLKLVNNLNIVYLSKQRIRSNLSINLISESLALSFGNTLTTQLSIELENSQTSHALDFLFYKDINLNNYIVPKLKYKNIKSCLLIQSHQFIDYYTSFLYLEALTSKSLEIVKFKVNQSDIKQVLLISNDNCVIIEKNLLPNKKVTDFILNSTQIDHIGKIILDNKKFFTVQKGRPYFFPNCQVTKILKKVNINYKGMPKKRRKTHSEVIKKIHLNSSNRLKILVEISTNESRISSRKNKESPSIIQFSKLFLKKNGKLYSSMIPRFLKQFTVGKIQDIHHFVNRHLFLYDKIEWDPNYKPPKDEDERRIECSTTTLIRNSKTHSNSSPFCGYGLILAKFLEYPCIKASKSIGLYSITEDFFEKELNHVFTPTSQFLEDGTTLGFLHFEKEITGDIVQGLPRIEEILEARKKNQFLKQLPTNQKKGLVVQKTSLDQNFEFHKIGNPLQENEKINPHKLLKAYFNYYGFLKPFFCYRQKMVKYARLISNFEGSYKSFKKVQALILNSVQGVYKSQGVRINAKHLEVIIKQMTTKVLITNEGDTPLLKREVIDLYHIEYINRIIRKEKKNCAYYLPLLFGITRAALNNPSFISAASFQETTKVLTKAAIEGRIDWLRGLKENIITGHLIPAGTGSRNYKTSFKKPLLVSSKKKNSSEFTQS